MEYVELLGIHPPTFKSKLFTIFSAIPNPYSNKEIALIIDKLINNKKIRFEFDLPSDKGIDFISDLLDFGVLIGNSSIHEEGENQGIQAG